jgi:transposase-like protein
MKTVSPNFPKGLMETTRYFSDQRICLELVAKSKWPSGPACPRCASKRLSFLETRLIWKCLDCKKQFSVKVGTILEDSAVPLGKWLTAMWLLSNCKNGISSRELAGALGVMQRTAWFMLHRIRYAMHAGSINKRLGTVEADEAGASWNVPSRQPM